MIYRGVSGYPHLVVDELIAMRQLPYFTPTPASTSIPGLDMMAVVVAVPWSLRIFSESALMAACIFAKSKR